MNMIDRTGKAEHPTRRLLIDTAERLMAEQGVEHVSLRQITLAAGQRNRAALHYHFGSREGLIEAIFTDRMGRINERRLALVEELAQQRGENDLRRVVAARVRPLAERILERGTEDYYVRFLAQANLSPQVDVARLIRGRLDEGLMRTSRLIQRILPQVPHRLLNQRIAMSGSLMVYALAERQTSLIQAAGANAQGPRNWHGEMARYVENLIDLIAGGLAATSG